MMPSVFAAAVAWRHGAGTGAWRRAALVLRRAVVPRVHRRVAPVRQTHQHLTARIVLHPLHTQTVLRHSTTVREAARAGRDLPPRIVTRAAAQPAPARSPERAAPAAAGFPMALARPVPMITRRAAPVEPSAPVAAMPSRPGPREPDAIAAAVRTPPSALPALELERVTDHVLRSLDRRLSSWRDRRGKS
jgi:hypothetical protein